MSEFTNPYPTTTDLTANSIFIPTEYSSITTSDTTVYDPPMRGIWVGVGGNVAVKTARGTTAVIPNVPGGTILPGYFTQVRSTNTEATNMFAIY